MLGAPWTTLRAFGTPGGMIADEQELRTAFQLFADPEHAVEIVALFSGKFRVIPGTHVEAAVAAVNDLPAGIGVYFRINPIEQTRTEPAKNGDIIKRRWIYIDVDPVKGEKDDSATDQEKMAAGEVCDSLVEFLSAKGWPAPVVVDSGNGCGLLYRCDLPNDRISQALLRQLLKNLSDQFSGPKGTIDKSVHNANRLAKLPGTWAKKGTPSESRPHRPCKLVYIPKKLEEVTSELLAASCGNPEQAPEPERAPKPSINGTPAHHLNRIEAYARKALDNECARVALSRSPAQGGEGRNNNLNRAAFALGGLIAAGALTREEVERQLFEAAVASGLHQDDGGERGIRSTIRSGIEAGMAHPRELPENRRDPLAVFGKREPLAEGEPLTIKLSRVTPLQVEWLIRDRIPKRFITIFAGRTGVGKSFVAHDIIARLSVGGEIPFSGGECFPPGGTLIVSEDSHEYVLAPRLIESGANMDRIHAMTWKAMGSYHLGNTDMLSQAVSEVEGGVSLVMIDPPTNFLADTDEHKNSEIRQLVMRVVEWALDRDLAVLFILHVNKQTGKGVEALNRVMGSVAWVTTARIAHTFCADSGTPGQCLWVPLKNNLGRLTKALAYRIKPNDDGAAGVEWIAEVDTTADEAMGHAAPKVRRDIAAGEWLIERFREKLEWSSDDLFRHAREANISRNAMFEAKKILELPRARQVIDEGGNKTFYWWVPKDWVHFDSKPEQEETQ